MSRFTLTMTLRDKEGFEAPLSLAVDLDATVRIHPRTVGLIKAGLSTFDGTIETMKVRSFRKELFVETATRLGALLAERMEDAEGWHDESRIDPARKQLGGSWSHD